MRVVIDPSVYISAALSPSGTPAHLMRRWRLRQFDMIVSAKLIEELDSTLRRNRFRDYVALEVFADALVSGDRDLIALVDPPLPILTPRALLDHLTASPGM